MNRSPLPKILLGVAAFLAIWSLGLCYTYINRTRQIRMIQLESARLTQKNQIVAMIVNEAMEYGKTHPAIEPILAPIKAAKPAQATVPATQPTPKPGTK